MHDLDREQPITVRDAHQEDVPEMAALLAQLGHPCSPEEIRARLDAFAKSPGDFIYVAEKTGQALGVATVHWTPMLHREQPIARITALVVHEDARGQGIGGRLVAHVADAARQAGLTILEVTSNVKRLDAHAFYRKLDFDQASHCFRKPL